MWTSACARTVTGAASIRRVTTVVIVIVSISDVAVLRASISGTSDPSAAYRACCHVKSIQDVMRLG